MAGDRFKNVRPEPGHSVVLVVEGGKIQTTGQYGPKLLLWNKTEAQNLELPEKFGNLMVEMGLGTWDVKDRGKYFQPKKPVAVKFTRPSQPKTPWEMQVVDGNSGQQQSASNTPERRTMAPAGAPWATLRQQYSAAMAQAVDMIGNLDAAALANARKRLDVTIDLNAIAFTIYKAAVDRGITIPATTEREEFAKLPEALTEDQDDLPF